MKLALVVEKFATSGGLERYVCELARRLALRHDVHVIASKFGADAGGLPLSLHRIARLPGGLLNLIVFDRLATARATRLGADVVLGFGRTTRQDVHRAGGGCHAIYSMMLPPWKRWGLKNRLELARERSLYTGGGTGLFVFNSTLIREQVRLLYGVEERRTVIIHTPVDTTRFHPPTPEERIRLRAALGLDEREPVFLFASLNHQRKGLPALIEAWPEVSATLLVAGPRLRPGLISRIRDLGLEARIRELGTGHRMEELCRAADFFVHPTLYDACANTVLQAMASGLVSIISARDGATDHLREGGNGLLLREPERPEQIAAACNAALALSPENRTRIAMAARATMEPLTWERHVTDWEAVIARIGGL